MHPDPRSVPAPALPPAPRPGVTNTTWWWFAAAPAPWSPPGTDPATAAAQARAYRRQQACQLLAAQPALAGELRIGRPDVPHREYDDGGLVDVNHLSAQ